jgi:hypothetical protein
LRGTGCTIIRRFPAACANGRQSGFRNAFLSVADLQACIHQFLEVWNSEPNPFVWTATVESIQEKLSRCHRKIAPGETLSALA